MAGHSKWANIKHRKAAQDKKRGKIFTKLIDMLKELYAVSEVYCNTGFCEDVMAQLNEAGA